MRGGEEGYTHTRLSVGSTDFQFFLIPPLAYWAEQTFTLQQDGKESAHYLILLRAPEEDDTLSSYTLLGTPQYMLAHQGSGTAGNHTGSLGRQAFVPGHLECFYL